MQNTYIEAENTASFICFKSSESFSADGNSVFFGHHESLFHVSDISEEHTTMCVSK
jgi:hypothetical protein